MTGAAPHALVMAKSPVPGQVKTRLCPPCSPAEAAEIAAAALADTLEAVARCGAARKIVAVDGPVGPWLPEGFTVLVQQGATFQERLARAWAEAGGPGVQIGMDTPQVTAMLLDDALSALDGDDAALGLALDGGWWALALRRSRPGVFDGVPMSTSSTGRRQRDRLAALGLSVADLPELRDVDTMEDLRAVCESAPWTRTAALSSCLATA